MFTAINAAGLSALLLAATSAPTTSAPQLDVGRAPIELGLIFELNATDDDAEVVLEINSEIAIDRLFLFDPDFRPILQLASNDREGLGLAEVIIESAEPSVAAVLAAYPEGPYAAFVRTTGHEWLFLRAELSHDLPAQPVITSPAPGGSVPPNGALVTWQADPEVESWTVEVEHDDLGLSLNVELPGSVTSFSIPDGFLVSGEEFELGIAAAGEAGNVIVVETSFTVQ